ncbi:Purine nucleoside phosphorylase 1 [Caloramator mitchellensis]|uniref:Purine nucleoside phosphorylase n=1 Tax=Caloramator mitchellensis TaxID=908809 RepID=A0A0R3JUS6_CALMK|nr:purine-nucleoside phosphorylase [Caloramator mitchellensis]KRQ86810.1 Purine nucleoside phosphorylase 1 [Caloramator mitchellensis]
MNYLNRINEAKEYIKSKIKKTPDVAVILGSGLGKLAGEIENKMVIKYSEVPHFPESTVVGHAGEFIFGNIGDKFVMAMNGRFHYYEGHDMKDVTLPIRVMRALGIEKIIVTNAAGGMNPEFEAGDLMLITDHINFIGTNPLIGRNFEELGPRFPDMSQAYNRELIAIAENCANKLDIKVQKGVYVAVSGPNYETPAELRMLRIMGADAVGMSTVPEVIVANHGGMKVLGISCITDMAIPDNLEPLDHERVVATAARATEKFVKLVKEIIVNI